MAGSNVAKNSPRPSPSRTHVGPVPRQSPLTPSFRRISRTTWPMLGCSGGAVTAAARAFLVAAVAAVVAAVAAVVAAAVLAGFVAGFVAAAVAAVAAAVAAVVAALAVRPIAAFTAADFSDRAPTSFAADAADVDAIFPTDGEDDPCRCVRITSNGCSRTPSPNKLRLFHMDAQRSRERFARLLAGDADGAQQLGAQQQGASGESSRDGNDSTDPLPLAMLTWHEDITYASVCLFLPDPFSLPPLLNPSSLLPTPLPSLFPPSSPHFIQLPMPPPSSRLASLSPALRVPRRLLRRLKSLRVPRRALPAAYRTRRSAGSCLVTHALSSLPCPPPLLLTPLLPSSARTQTSSASGIPHQAQQHRQARTKLSFYAFCLPPLPLSLVSSSSPQLCAYPDELCQQHTTPGAAAAGAAAAAAAAATDGAAIQGNAEAGSLEAGNAEAGSAEAGNTEEAGATGKAGGEAGHQGSIPAAVKAAVLSELHSNGYLKAFQALVSEGQGLAGRDDIMAEIRAVAAECTQLQAVAGGFKQAVTLRRQYSKGSAKPPGAKSGKAGGTVSAGADPLTVFVVDRIRQFSSWDTKHALLGAHSISAAPSSASSKRTSLKRLTSTPVNTNRRSLAKATLVAAAVADSGDGTDGGKKKEEEKPKKKSGFFKLGLKEGKEKGNGGGKAGGGAGGKGEKVSVQEILRGLYLFNNAAYIQSLFPDLRMSKEFRQLADTQMNRFLDVLLKDMMSSIGAPTTNISPAEFQKRLDAFNVAFEELCFNMRRFHVHDSVARTQIRGVCHERILSTYKEFLMPFREDLVGFPEYRWSVSSAKRVMQNFFI
ncbi:unnamed protein product [Closterium sp. Yama58-4]|nr:unnamed protein product [Closterium sp. Yama58-4]